MLIKSTFGQFFPAFGDGNTLVAIGVASVGIWALHFMILRGTQEAAALNKIGTVAKVIPILVFLLLIVYFKPDLFASNLYGGDLNSSVFEQVRSTMLVTVFVFLGRGYGPKSTTCRLTGIWLRCVPASTLRSMTPGVPFANIASALLMSSTPVPVNWRNT